MLEQYTQGKTNQDQVFKSLPALIGKEYAIQAVQYGLSEGIFKVCIHTNII
jgi:hypothetical protein